MTFSSQNFLIYFLPIFLLLYFIRKNINYKNIIIITFSIIFYYNSRPIFILFLLVSIFFNFLLGIYIDRAGEAHRKLLLICGATANLAMLMVFKYTTFFVENINVMLAFTNVSLPVPRMKLPLGISFYTFHAISYITDVAKRRTPANRRFQEFMLYMSMFPQLVAGPIVRYSRVAAQLRARRVTLGRFSAGMRVLILGLAWKLLIADTISPIADTVFDSSSAPSFVTAWLGLYAYSMQIYFDFGGYSAMAVGLGIIMGFTLPRNFRLPYAASSITAFWRSWHMSLSAWLRDYLYIPMGGSRGSPLRTYMNLWTVFLLCGLWHGASWTFVVWGGYHGLLLVFERAGGGRLLAHVPVEVAHGYTVVVAFLGWVWFRADNITDAMRMFRGLFGLNGIGDLSIELDILMSPVVITALAVSGALSLWKWPRWQLLPLGDNGRLAVAIGDTVFLATLLIFCTIVAASSSYSPFLYYRF